MSWSLHILKNPIRKVSFPYQNFVTANCLLDVLQTFHFPTLQSVVARTATDVKQEVLYHSLSICCEVNLWRQAQTICRQDQSMEENDSFCSLRDKSIILFTWDNRILHMGAPISEWILHLTSVCRDHENSSWTRHRGIRYQSTDQWRMSYMKIFVISSCTTQILHVKSSHWLHCNLMKQSKTSILTTNVGIILPRFGSDHLFLLIIFNANFLWDVCFETVFLHCVSTIK